MVTTSMEERKGKEGVLGRGSGVVITSQADPMRGMVLQRCPALLQRDVLICLHAGIP